MEHRHGGIKIRWNTDEQTSLAQELVSVDEDMQRGLMTYSRLKRQPLTALGSQQREPYFLHL